MTINSASASIVAGFFLIAAASGQVQMSPALAAPRPPIAGRLPVGAVPAVSSSAAAQVDLRQLAESMKLMSPKERKQLNKAIKQMTPVERKRLVEAIQRQLAGKPAASQATKPREIKKIQPLPPRLAYNR